ncbi:MAG: hypothetical protein ACK5LM_01720 [Lactovum sp.]
MFFYLKYGEIEKLIGVFKFVSYDLENGEITKGMGYFGKSEKNESKEQIKFNKREKENGTDIYIMTFDSSSFRDCKSEIIYLVLNSFSLPIYQKRLTVEVEEKSMTKSYISEYLKESKKIKTIRI